MSFDDIQTITFLEWLPTALLYFLGITAVLSLGGLFIGYLASAMQHGPVEGLNVTAKTVFAGFSDLAMSPRRIWALTVLAIKESLRRYVLVVFVVFVFIILFAGWFLDSSSDHPARVYLSFVLTASNYLTLVLALFLSAFSLPSDIENRTIYTIVTKPVLAAEIVLGRIFGFTLVGTAMLVPMCFISYFFVTRGLAHNHEIDGPAVSAKLDPGATAEINAGETTLNSGHRHEVIVEPDGTVRLENAKGHTHTVTASGAGENATYTAGTARGMLQARVPLIGKLRFLDSAGRPGTGINVGEEWAYRSYIEGDSLAAAIYSFDGVYAGDFANSLTAEEQKAQDTPEENRDEKQRALAESASLKQGLPLELTLAVFRSHKGDIERRIVGEIVVRHPDSSKKLQSERLPFVSQEFSTQRISIPRKLKRQDADGRLVDVDLFDDLTEDGKVEIMVYCAERGQYFGMARHDVYIRASENSFAWNFVKAHISIWLVMVLVISLGVAGSTLLNGPVAMICTFMLIIMGFFKSFITNVADSVLYGKETAWGGGPVESVVRMITQKSIMVELDVPGEGAIKLIDQAIMGSVYLTSFMLPDFASFNTSKFVAYGFNIDGSTLMIQVFQTLAFFLTLTILSYFFLRTRELAK